MLEKTRNKSNCLQIVENSFKDPEMNNHIYNKLDLFNENKIHKLRDKYFKQRIVLIGTWEM